MVAWLRLGTLTLAFVGTAALAAHFACGRGSADSATLRIAVRADITGLFPNPSTQREAFTIDMNRNLFDGLVGLDRDFRPVPALALRWENPDERTWVFHLRPGAHFSDGRRVTANDVAASLHATLTRPFATAAFLHPIESVVARGEDRIEVRTAHPFPMLLSHLSVGFVLPAEALRRTPVPAIGSGAYVVDRWQPGRELVLRANPHHWGAPPTFQRVHMKVMPDAEQRVRALVAGEAHLIDNVPLELLPSLRGRPGIRVVSRPSLRVVFLALRVDRKPFSDARVREAVDLGLDRDELVRRALSGQAAVATQLVSPAVFGYNAAITSPTPDTARARRLLAEAGLPDGFDVRLDGPSNRYVRDVEIAEEIRRQLAALGIRVEVRTQPKHEYLPYLARGESSAYLLGWTCDTLQAGDVLDGVMRSQRPGMPANMNYQGLADPELDRLIDEANGTASLERRGALLSQALARVARMRWVIPLEVQPEAVAFADHLDWAPPPSFALRLHEIVPARAAGAAAQ